MECPTAFVNTDSVRFPRADFGTTTVQLSDGHRPTGLADEEDFNSLLIPKTSTEVEGEVSSVLAGDAGG